MASRWLLARLRECIAQLISRQTSDDAAPGTDREQEARSDATLAEATFIHRTLEDHAEEIERNLAARRILSQLESEARLQEKDKDR